MGKKPVSAQTNPGTVTNGAEALISALGQFAASIELDKVPVLVKAQAKLCILDTIGCMVAGSELDDGRALIAAEEGLANRAEATALGIPERLSMMAAARINGYLGDILELNDLIGGHASISNVSAALAVAEARGRSGADLLRAVIGGIETTSRIHAAFRKDMKPYTEVGIAGVGLVGTFGSAAAVASLYGLGPTRTAEAIAISGALAGWCPAEVIFRHGGTIKPLLFGSWPASVGILAAQYASHAITGPAKLLEGDLGFFATTATKFNAAEILAPEKWHLAEPRRKLHACCGYIHSPIDVVAALRREKGPEIFRGAEIHVRLNPPVVAAVSKRGLPATPNDARFHGQYCIALAADGADIIRPEHSAHFGRYLERETIRSLAGRISIEGDPGCENYQESVVEVISNDGTRLEVRGNSPKGSPANPMTDAEVIEKFLRLTANQLAPAEAQDYIQRVKALESQPDCSWLLQCFTAKAGNARVVR